MKIKSINDYIVVEDIKEDEKSGNIFLVKTSSTVVKSKIVDISKKIEDETGLKQNQIILRPYNPSYQYQDFYLINYKDIIGVIE